MKIRPIIFSAPMVRALLAGTKTQTRRLMKIRSIDGKLVTIHPPESLVLFDEADGTKSLQYVSTAAMSGPYRLPYQSGDHLYVRESWRPVHSCDPTRGARYMADVDRDQTVWRPSIHMPRWASRLTLEVTDVRVEALQSISKADVMSEGIREMHGQPLADVWGGWHEPYAALWERLHGRGSWAVNPFVIAVAFKVHQVNVDKMIGEKAA